MTPSPVQRGNKRQSCFYADEDDRFYLDWLREHADKTGCRIHAYGLMSNRVHLLISAERPGATGALMKALGQRYVQYVNRTYCRSGTLWKGRFSSCLTQEETYLPASITSTGLSFDKGFIFWSAPLGAA